jgi:hypothetical protein
MLLDIGYVLFSRKVIATMKDDTFRSRLINGLFKHIYDNDFKKNSLIPDLLDQGVQVKTSYTNFMYMTEHDKNKMPRTSIVLWDEGGV